MCMKKTLHPSFIYVMLIENTLSDSRFKTFTLVNFNKKKTQNITDIKKKFCILGPYYLQPGMGFQHSCQDQQRLFFWVEQSGKVVLQRKTQ